MSKPIKLTSEMLESIQKEFIETVKNQKMFGGKLTYEKSFKWQGDDRASVLFTATAFAKMLMLVQNFETEVAWHGVAKRSEKAENAFVISDILVYPQKVSGGNVETDQVKYQEWLYSLDDDTFNNLRMQGHSHVNFSTTPSGVDETHQEKILSQLGEDMFYIFMIWNKKLSKNIRVFDLKNNTLYDTDDVDVYIGAKGCNLDDFLSNAKTFVTEAYTPPYGGMYGGTYKSYQYNQQTAKTPATAPVKTPEKKELPKKEVPEIGTNSSGYDFGYGRYQYGGDDDDPYSIYGIEK